jgi:hypothetical protein
MPALHDEVAFEYRTGAGAGAGVPLLFRTQWPSFLVFFGASFRLKTVLVKLFVYSKLFAKQENYRTKSESIAL